MFTTEQLQQRKCQACEGGVPIVPPDQARDQLKAVHADWQLNEDGKSIQRRWKLKNFDQALKLANAIGALAEQEQHHPDIHLTGYRLLRIDLTTHAIGGLSENDFILAAKIDALSASLGTSQ